MKRPTAVALIVVLTAALAAPAHGHAGRAAPTLTADGQRSAAEVAATTILVGFQSGADRNEVHERTGLRVVGSIPELAVDVVSVPDGRLAEAIRTYRDLDGVAYAERNRGVRVAAARPNDEFFDDQYALGRIRALRGWARYGHRWRRTGGARIAVIDSGVDRFHPELAGKITHCRSWLTGLAVGVPECQDTQVHGTHVAGIAAARTHDRMGVAGVAFDARIMALQAINSAGVGLTADIAAAIVYAARNGAHVANYSFSAATPSATERRAVVYARSRGVSQVAAAGNTGNAGVEYPARYGHVIAVSALDRRNRLASFSTYGPGTEVAAPGEEILSTVPGAVDYAYFSGTSMAAPHVAGLAALLRAKGYGVKATRRRIRRGALDLGPRGRDTRYGFGIISINRTLWL